MRKKVLITGSCGFRGGNFMRHAIHAKAPFDYVSLDKVVGSANSIYYNKNHQFYLADCCDKHILNKIFEIERPNYVFHFANEKQTSDKFVESNILGTTNLLSRCRNFSVEKFIYSSSWIDESVDVYNAFDASKFAAELMIRSSGVSYNIVRSQESYGPRQSPRQLVPNMIKSSIDDWSSNDEEFVSLTHVADSSSAMLTAALYGKKNATYNVVGEQVSMTNLYKMVESYVSKKTINPQILSGILKHERDLSLVKIGWSPQHKLATSLKEVVDWYEINNYFLNQ